MNVTFVTGNANKAKYFSELIGMPISYHSVDIHEIQSLDLKEIARHKARLAYEQLKKPVLVEDVSLTINYLTQEAIVTLAGIQISFLPVLN
jgi:inosine/xanthosine triphosphate pyrophosphatase family protein